MLLNSSAIKAKLDRLFGLSLNRYRQNSDHSDVVEQQKKPPLERIYTNEAPMAVIRSRRETEKKPNLQKEILVLSQEDKGFLFVPKLFVWVPDVALITFVFFSILCYHPAIPLAESISLIQQIERR